MTEAFQLPVTHLSHDVERTTKFTRDYHFNKSLHSKQKLIWLVVEPTHLKNMSQNWNLPQIGVKKKMKPPPSHGGVGNEFFTSQNLRISFPKPPSVDLDVAFFESKIPKMPVETNTRSKRNLRLQKWDGLLVPPSQGWDVNLKNHGK